MFRRKMPHPWQRDLMRFFLSYFRMYIRICRRLTSVVYDRAYSSHLGQRQCCGCLCVSVGIFVVFRRCVELVRAPQVPTVIRIHQATCVIERDRARAHREGTRILANARTHNLARCWAGCYSHADITAQRVCLGIDPGQRRAMKVRLVRWCER